MVLDGRLLLSAERGAVFVSVTKEVGGMCASLAWHCEGKSGFWCVEKNTVNLEKLACRPPLCERLC